jgi:hypothetical protein
MKRPLCRTVASTFVALVALGVATPPVFADQEPGRGFFGFTPRLTSEGVTVVKLTPGGASEAAGIRTGDVIVLVNGEPPVPNDEGGLLQVFTRFRAGDEVEVVVRRSGDLKTFQLALGAVPPLAREDQQRVEALERKVRASRIVEKMLATLDEFDLSFSEEGRLLFRESAKDEWQTLEPEVARTFEGVARHFLKDRRDNVLRLKVKRGDDGSVELVVVP